MENWTICFVIEQNKIYCINDIDKFKIIHKFTQLYVAFLRQHSFYMSLSRVPSLSLSLKENDFIKAVGDEI